MKKYDECFTVDRQSWGTYQSYDENGNKLITSLTEESCREATRWYLKHLQDQGKQ